MPTVSFLVLRLCIWLRGGTQGRIMLLHWKITFGCGPWWHITSDKPVTKHVRYFEGTQQKSLWKCHTSALPTPQLWKKFRNFYSAWTMPWKVAVLNGRLLQGCGNGHVTRTTLVRCWCGGVPSCWVRPPWRASSGSLSSAHSSPWRYFSSSAVFQYSRRKPMRSMEGGAAKNFSILQMFNRCCLSVPHNI